MKKKQTSAAALLPRFEKHLQAKRFFKPKQKILVACSGGPDSVALFHLLRAVAKKHRWKLGLLHFNHRLRPRAAKTDERFVRELARKSKVPFCCGSADVSAAAKRSKTSLEECARHLRYEFFLCAARARKTPAVALAHTRDDQAETVLMRILQGTGLRGLRGIRETVRMGKVTLVRPLLDSAKEELLGYLAAQDLKFRRDRSNHSRKFVRNRIRLELMPRLRRDFNPRVVEALSRIPVIAADEGALIADLEGHAWRKTFRRGRERKVRLRRAAFLGLHPALQFRVLEKALKRLDRGSGLSFEAWGRLRSGLARPRFRCSLPRDIDFELTPKNVTIYKKPSALNRV